MLFVGVLIFATAVPISLYAARYGVDIDLLTRGAGFGYLGSTITSLIYASFTFLFFAIEASIMALALQLCLGLPLWIGYIVSAVVVIPLVIYGISLISRFQIWTQPLWIGLNLLPLGFIAWKSGPAFGDLLSYPGASEAVGSISTFMGYPISGFDLAQFGLASGILLGAVGADRRAGGFPPLRPAGRDVRIGEQSALVARRARGRGGLDPARHVQDHARRLPGGARPGAGRALRSGGRADADVCGRLRLRDAVAGRGRSSSPACSW